VRLIRWAPWLLAGPITGPLAAVAVAYARAGRWGMAAVCAIGVAEAWTLLPAVLAWELAFLRTHCGWP
jgi:hypothetical protein